MDGQRGRRLSRGGAVIATSEHGPIEPAGSTEGLRRLPSRFRCHLHAVWDDGDAHTYPWFLGSIAYALSFGLQAFFLDARFWDDWQTNFLLTGEATKSYWSEVGVLPIYGAIQSDLLNNWPPAFRLVQLASFFIMGWLFFLVLKSLRVPQWFAATACISFLILPIDSARVAMSMLNYTLSLLFFFVGWVVLVLPSSRWRWPAALTVFFVSFSTLSLLPFFLLPVLHVGWLDLRRSIRPWVAALRAAGLLLFPIGYWFVWRRIYPPADSLTDYFTPGISGIARGALLLMFAAAFLGTVVVGRRHFGNDYWRCVALGFGLLAIALGSLGYMASGRMISVSEWMLNFVPHASDWDSRNQLLLGVGLSLFLASIVGRPTSPMRQLGLGSIVVVMIALNITYMQAYLLDHRKQEAVIAAIAAKPALIGQRFVSIEDQTPRFNARGRNYRWYEIAGMAKAALARSPEQERTFGRMNFSSSFTCGNATESPDSPSLEAMSDWSPTTVVVITSNRGPLRALLALNPMIQVFFDVEPCD